MDRRQKDLKVMAEAAGLSALKFGRKGGRVYLTCQADNGATRIFSVSNGTTNDYRGDANEQSAMKRWARENPAPDVPTTTPAPPPQQKAPSMPRNTTPAPATIAEQLQPLKKPGGQVLDLAPVEFLRFAKWLSNQDLTRIASMDDLVLLACKHMEKPVDEATVRAAMPEVGLAEPEHWGEPTDAQAIIVREIGLLLKGLGQEPTPAFKKLHGLLMP